MFASVTPCNKSRFDYSDEAANRISPTGGPKNTGRSICDSPRTYRGKGRLENEEIWMRAPDDAGRGAETPRAVPVYFNFLPDRPAYFF